jgi:arylsulfatase
VLLFLGEKLMAVKWRNYKFHLDRLYRVDGAFEDWSFPRAFNLASDPKERWNITWQNRWIGEEIGPFVAAYQQSVEKYPNLAAGQPNDRAPSYGEEDPAAETGAEGVDRKLGSLKEH